MKHAGRFTPIEQQRILSVIEDCYDIETEDQFKHFICNELNSILPHDYFGCGFGTIDPEKSSMHANLLINLNFDPGYFSSIVNSNGIASSPSINSWCKSRKVQVQSWQDIAKVNPHWGHIMKDYKVNNVVSHGLTDVHDRSVGYFAFSNLGSPDDPAQERLVEMLVPHLYEVTKKIYSPLIIKKQILSLRQQEVLKWAAIGKTSAEIAVLLNLSPCTVQIHFGKAMKKLNVFSRTHAVAKAISLGMIQI